MLRAEFLRGIGRLTQFELTYDILIYPRQLPAANRVGEAFSDQPFVLDHIAKPFIKDGAISPWREQIRELAKSKNVSCKVSGMVTEANHANWKPADFKPYSRLCSRNFGRIGLMYGSDWPVCLLAAVMRKVFGLVDDYVRQLTPAARDKFFGANAAQFYRLPKVESNLER